MVDRTIELIDRLGPERIAHMGAVKGDANDRQVALAYHPFAVVDALHPAMVGDVGVGEASNRTPATWVENLGDFARKWSNCHATIVPA